VVLRLDFVSTREAEFSLKLNVQCAPAFLPIQYITEPQSRIQAYRRLAEVTTTDQLGSLRAAWRDRFGPLPEPAINLLMLTELKLLGAARKMNVVEVRESKVMLTRGGDYILLGGKFPRLETQTPNQRLAELATLIRSF